MQGTASSAHRVSSCARRSWSMMVKSTTPGWRSISARRACELLWRAHQRVDMFDRLIVGIVGHRGARHGIQGLAGRIRDEMHVEKCGA